MASLPHVHDRTVSHATPKAPGQDHRAKLETYEQKLNQDRSWALMEGSRHFEEKSSVHEALHRIARKLNEIGVPYAVVGGMALFAHGFRRFTEDVDILVTREGLQLIHEKLEGLGYMPPFATSKNLRDTELGVKIEFLITGDYPGDGRPKPVAFPDPSKVSVELDGIRYINLVNIVELKLASGMTGATRMGDLADVIKLIRALNIPADFAGQLNPYVRAKFHELWRDSRGRFVQVWQDQSLAPGIRTIEELAASLPEAAETLTAMKTDGVMLDSDLSRADRIVLVTTDPAVAAKYDMHNEEDVG